MEFETAAFWLDTIAIGLAVLWAVGGMFVFLSAQVVGERVEGEAKIDQAPRDFVLRAKDALSRGAANSPLARIELLEVRDDALVWQSRGPGIRRAGSLRASGSGSSGRVAWQLEAQTGLITGARWVVAVGAVVTVVLYYMMSEFVLPSEKPPVRGQVFQMLQAMHTLWPPFLLAGLARGMKRRLVTDLERLLGNLKFDNAA